MFLLVIEPPNFSAQRFSAGLFASQRPGQVTGRESNVKERFAISRERYHHLAVQTETEVNNRD
jgi:hypothetical protein